MEMEKKTGRCCLLGLAPVAWLSTLVGWGPSSRMDGGKKWMGARLRGIEALLSAL